MILQWYAIQVRSGSEKKAVTSIMENAVKAGVDKHIREIVIPVEKISKVIRGKEVNVEKNLYPGYVIANIKKSDLLSNVIKRSQNVVSLMSRAISQRELEVIKHNAEQGKIVKESKDVFEVGENIEIIDGPFESFSGRIDDVDIVKMRVKVIVSIFGRDTPVELSYEQVKKYKQ